MMKFMRQALLTLCFVAALLSLPAIAQTNPGGTGTIATETQTEQGAGEASYGWVGLLGLAGLAGLLRRREEPARSHTNEPITSR